MIVQRAFICEGPVFWPHPEVSWSVTWETDPKCEDSWARKSLASQPDEVKACWMCGKMPKFPPQLS
jgi:hypothetical protein